MTLYDCSQHFETKLLKYIYVIETENKIYYIRSFPKNFFHLTGLQRTREFASIQNVNKFYFDCKNNKYTKEIKDYNFVNKSNINMVDMKPKVLSRIDEVILKADKLYHVSDKNGEEGVAISVSLPLRKITKNFTVVFKLDKETKWFVAASLQLDKDYKSSLVSKANSEEDILNVRALLKTSPEAQEIINVGLTLIEIGSNELITIRYYDTPASAGNGVPIINEDFSGITIKNYYGIDETFYAIRIDGQSMYPKYNNGDIVLVKEQNLIDLDQIGVFNINGFGYLKKYTENGLISLNPDFDNVPYDSFGENYCCGIVKTILNKSDIIEIMDRDNYYDKMNKQNKIVSEK